MRSTMVLFGLVIVEAVFILEHELRRVLLDLLANDDQQREGVAQEKDEEDKTQHKHLERTIIIIITAFL